MTTGFGVAVGGRGVAGTAVGGGGAAVAGSGVGGTTVAMAAGAAVGEDSAAAALRAVAVLASDATDRERRVAARDWLPGEVSSSPHAAANPNRTTAARLRKALKMTRSTLRTIRALADSFRETNAVSRPPPAP